MKKKELERRIVALEAQVELLSRRPVVVPSSPSYVYPYTPVYTYTVWSSSNTSTTNTLTLNRPDDGEPPALTAVS